MKVEPIAVETDKARLTIGDLFREALDQLAGNRRNHIHAVDEVQTLARTRFLEAAQPIPPRCPA